MMVKKFHNKNYKLGAMQSKILPKEDKLAVELRELGFANKIIDTLIGEMEKPEGKVRIQWIKKLVKEYGFPPSNIDINVAAGIGRDAGKRNVPVRADIVVYRDTHKTKPFVVIETKAPRKKEGIQQAESYARNLGVEYHLWSNGMREYYFKTSRYPNQSESISRLPIWVGDKPIVQKVPKTEDLRPFKDEVELRKVIGFCHDLILEKLGHDPAKAFDEMTKLLFLKLYDEREVPKYYEFSVLAGEKSQDVASKIIKLFNKAISSSKYRDVFISKFNQIPNKKPTVMLELDDFTILKIVQILQGYSLVKTTENIHGADIKGTVYEQMVGNTFRGELAQFFTPREIVDFIVEVIKPSREDKVFDPACGSGGFLIMVLRKLREYIKIDNPNLSDPDVKAEIKYFAEHNSFGTDINDRMVRVAKMNMIMHGDGHSGIFNTNGLLTDVDLPTKLKTELKEGTVDVIFSNPPFAGREKDQLILKKFDLGVNENKTPISVSKEVLFVEKIIKLLRYGGKVGLVLPAGVFNNPNPIMRRLRDYIKKNTRILSLIALPHLAFQVTGANNEGNLIFLEKMETIPEDYTIYIDWARYVGFNTTGKKIPQNELRDILKRMGAPKPENQIRFSQLEDRIDPWYYHPTYRRINENLKHSKHPLAPISELVERSKDLFNPKKHPNDSFDYIETNDVDLEKGEIISSKEITGKTAPNRAKYVLREGDFIIPNARDCLRGVAVVLKEHEGKIATNRFFVVRPKKDKVNPKYLYYMFKQPEILCLLKQQATGEINPGIGYDALSKIGIPLPENRETQEKIVEQIEEQEKEKQRLFKQIAEHEQKVSKIVRVGILSFKAKHKALKKLGYDYIGDLEV